MSVHRRECQWIGCKKDSSSVSVVAMFDEDIPAPEGEIYFIDVLMLMGELSVCYVRLCAEHVSYFATSENRETVVMPFVARFCVQNGMEPKAFDLRILNLTESQLDKLTRQAGAPRRHKEVEER